MVLCYNLCMSFVAKFKKRMYFVAAGYFRFFANRALKRWNPRIIAITGSVGKTTMLHMVEYELGNRAHYSHDANSAFGIAFDLVGIRGITGSKLRWIYLILAVPFRSIFYKHTEEFYIVEIDGERPLEAGFLAKWLKPEMTLWPFAPYLRVMFNSFLTSPSTLNSAIKPSSRRILAISTFILLDGMLTEA